MQHIKLDTLTHSVSTQLHYKHLGQMPHTLYMHCGDSGCYILLGHKSNSVMPVTAKYY